MDDHKKSLQEKDNSGIFSKIGGLYNDMIDYGIEWMPIRIAITIIVWSFILLCFLAGWIESSLFPFFIIFSCLSGFVFTPGYLLSREIIRESRERIKRKKRESPENPPYKESSDTVLRWGDF